MNPPPLIIGLLKSKRDVPHQSTVGGLECSPSECLTDFLKQCYTASLVPVGNKWSPNPSDTLFNLASVEKEFIKRSRADKYTRSTFHHGIDEILKSKKPIEIEDIFTQPEGQSQLRCVLVEGPPGVGKSTFCWQLCRKWGCEQQQFLSDFSHVVLLRCREKCVQEAKEIADLFYHPDANIQQRAAESIISKGGKGVMIILDGFDELPAAIRKESLLVEIIKGSVLPACTVLVTSRPSATADLKSFTFQKHIEILGFRQEEIEKYTSHALSKDPELLADFKSYISLNPEIKIALYIPLNCEIVTFVFQDTGKPVSHTITQLYLEMSKIILKRYLTGKGRNELAKSLPKDLSELPPDIYYQLSKLGQMAFEGEMNQEVVFDKLPANCDHLDFMSESLDVFGRKVSYYTFLHKTIQELLAAFYFSQLTPIVQKIVFKEYYEKDHLKTLWKFVAGLTGFKGAAWTDMLDIYSSYGSGVTQWLYEAQNTNICDQVLKTGEKVNAVSISSPIDAHSVIWCVANSNGTWRFAFKVWGDEMYQAVVDSVSMYCNSARDLSIELLCFTCSMEELDMGLVKKLPICILRSIATLSLDDLSVRELDVELVSQLANLRYLRLLPMIPIENIIPLLPKLHDLYVSVSSDMRCEDIEAVLHSYSEIRSLVSLQVSLKSQPNPRCVEQVLRSVFSPSKLTALNLTYLTLHSSEQFGLLESNENLSTLDMFVALPCAPGMLEDLIRAISKNRKLNIVTFWLEEDGTNLVSLSAERFANLIRSNKTIEKIYLSNEFERSDIVGLISALKDSDTLEWLEFDQRNEHLFSAHELEEMDSRVIFTDYT